MSSYHDLMVHQANSDRNRLAGPELTAGLAREVSRTDVQQFLAKRQGEARRTRLHQIREFARTMTGSIASTLRQSGRIAR